MDQVSNRAATTAATTKEITLAEVITLVGSFEGAQGTVFIKSTRVSNNPLNFLLCSIFGSGGKRAFALGAGAGFLGGAVAAAGAMSVYHRYLQYKAMMSYGGYGGFGGYGGYGGFGSGLGYSPYGRSILINAHDCVGGCPMQAFCDYGICRCREGFEARFGSCHQNFGAEYNNKRLEYDRRTTASFNPYKPCSNHGECRIIDMNMICLPTNGTCQCRHDMKWNREVGECQIFMVRALPCFIFIFYHHFQSCFRMLIALVMSQRSCL